jgi:hypothetical protein
MWVERSDSVAHFKGVGPNGLVPTALAFALATVVILLAASPARAADDTVSILGKVADDSPLTPGLIDELIAAAPQAQGLEPASPISDWAFLRRVMLDLVGRIPTAAEHRLYFAEPAAVRRQRLVRRLVASDRFADRWAVWLGDVLRVRNGTPGGPELDRFLRHAMRERMPYDRIVQHLLTAVGTPGNDGAVGFFTAESADPLEMAGVVSQTLFGIRMHCARCHDHPFDHWKQREYYGFAAFFGQTRSVAGGRNRPTRLVDAAEQRVQWPPRDGPHAGGSPAPIRPDWPLPRETADQPAVAAAVERRRAATEPTADEALDDLLAAAVAEPTSSGGVLDTVAIAPEATEARRSELRQTVADLVVDPRNRFFARNLVNRLWATLMGRGLVEPVDDVRNDNPPSHPELLDHLALEFVANGHDIGRLATLIVASDAYARGHADRADAHLRDRLEAAFLAARLRPLSAEALHDSVVTAGHLHDVKHPAGANLKTIEERVLVRRDASEMDRDDDAAAGGTAASAAVAEATLAGRLAVSDADDGDAVMTDLAAAMMEADPLGAMRAASPEEMRRRRMAEEMAQPGGPVRPLPQDPAEIARLYRVEMVAREVDLNPRFESAIAMPLPAPEHHFLRLLGQSSREDIADAGGSRPHMRQALVLLNGPLVHEAARVGPLEPLGRVLADPGRRDVVRLLYVETLSREPRSREREIAEQVLASAATPADGIADLRWAILNSHEFRFMP